MNRVILVKPLLVHVFQKLLAVYENRKFNAAFTAACHWPLSWAKWIHFTTSHFISLRSILILSFHLCLGSCSGLFVLQVCSPENCNYFSPMRAMCPARLVLLDMIGLLSVWDRDVSGQAKWRKAYNLPCACRATGGGGYVSSDRQ
jgi:hypothetical protein